MRTNLFFVVITGLMLVGLICFQPVLACYGPHIDANVSQTQLNLGETVIVSGLICSNLTGPDVTIIVTFVRPNLSWIEHTIVTDEITGEFQVTQELDMVGYWNIFPKLGHMTDRLGVTVIDQKVDSETIIPLIDLPEIPYNFPLLAVAIILVGVGLITAITGRKRKTRSISSLRLLIQICFVMLIFFGMFADLGAISSPVRQLKVHEYLETPNILGVSLPDGLPVPIFGCYYPCGRTVTCALWEIQTYIYPAWNIGSGWGVEYAASGISRLAIVIGVIIFFSVILGKFVCGWLCPFGLYLDLITRFRKALKIKHRNLSDNFNEKFHQLGYVILALIIIICVIFGSEAIIGTQLIPGTEDGGFVYQYFSAPFCQVCPMKPFCVLLQSAANVIKPELVFEVTTGDFYELGYYVTSINLLVLGIVSVAAFYYRRSWCRICPLGALTAFFNRFPPFKWVSVLRLDKVEEKCTKCGICKRVCPTQVTEVYNKKDGDVTTSNCIMCLRCIEMCPYEDALQLKTAGKTVLRSRNWLEENKKKKKGVG